MLIGLCAWIIVIIIIIIIIIIFIIIIIISIILPNIARAIKSRRLRWTIRVARIEEGRSTFKILTGKSTGKRPLGRPMRRWEDNIRMNLEEIGNCVDSAQDRDYWRAFVNAALNLRVP